MYSFIFWGGNYGSLADWVSTLANIVIAILAWWAAVKADQYFKAEGEAKIETQIARTS